MLDPSHPLLELIRKDKRYRLEAYIFVFEALSYAQGVLKLGRHCASEGAAEEQLDEEEDQPERHVTGQELCEAIRQYALDQFGLMAKTVLNSWGIRRTRDFGEIVFSLIRIRQMRKTSEDRIEDFDDVYDFDAAFRAEFRIRPTETA